MKDDDKPGLVDLAKRLRTLGFTLCATGGTLEYLGRKGIPAVRVNKVREGSPHIVDKMISKEIALVINTTQGPADRRDSFSIRRTTLQRGLPYFTTLRAATAVATALNALRGVALDVRSLQEYHLALEA